LASASADAKRRGEEALRASTLAWTILRPSMIYGTPADRNVARLLRWMRSCPVLPLPGGGATPQQPVHVDDLVASILAALGRPVAIRGEYEVGGPRPVRLRELIAIGARALRLRVAVLPIPIAPVHATLELMVRFGVRPPLRPEQVMRLTESKAVDIA